MAATGRSSELRTSLLEHLLESSLKAPQLVPMALLKSNWLPLRGPGGAYGGLTQALLML